MGHCIEFSSLAVIKYLKVADDVISSRVLLGILFFEKMESEAVILTPKLLFFLSILKRFKSIKIQSLVEVL